MSDLDNFIDDARAVSVTDAAIILGYKLTRASYAGLAPSAAGRIASRYRRQSRPWNCRQCGRGGRDGIGLIGFVNDHDMRTRSGFLSACAEALGRDPPEGRSGRAKIIAPNVSRGSPAGKRRSAPSRRSPIRSTTPPCRRAEISSSRAEIGDDPEQSVVGRYLAARTGFTMHVAVLANLRLSPRHGILGRSGRARTQARGLRRPGDGCALRGPERAGDRLP